jgi:hypothetical protein
MGLARMWTWADARMFTEIMFFRGTTVISSPSHPKYPAVPEKLHRQMTAQAMSNGSFHPDKNRFPIDCVSHRAVGIVKRLCRQAAKP